MDIPSGGVFGILRVLFKPIVDLFSMLLFYRAYEISTLYHNHREAFGMPPDELAGSIEYKIIWKPYHLRKKLITPMIWVRAKDGKAFSKLVLLVAASNSKIKYQDYVTLFDINQIPVQAALPSIPFRNLKFEGNTVFTPYDDIQISIVELHDQAGNKLDLYYPSKKRLTPFDRLEVAMGLEKGDVERWGEIFNLEYIEMEIKEEKISLIGGRFGAPTLIDRLRAHIFGFNWLVKIFFWSKNLITARHLASEFSKYLQEQEEFKRWKEENRQKEVA